jgi:serine/threonine-protein kinase HipA
MSRALSVWWDDAIVGTLRVDQHGDMTFVYAAEWLADSSRLSLSISLPRRPEPFNRRECRPFFAGLLPEEAQLEAVARALGISKRNDFRLLEALGGDVAGALSLWPEGEAPPAADTVEHTKPLDDGAIAELLDTLPKRPLLAGEKGLRLSLAGAQSKLPVVLVDGKVALPAVGEPTTHILKPPITHFPTTTENEALVMRLAAALELSVASVDARTAAGRPYLLVTRYDRRVDESGRARRLHQEDFCQALGIPPERKYAEEGGPTFKTSFDLLRRASTRPAVEVLKFLDAAIFNAMVGNSDAHGKNFSLLYRAGEVTLAPLYDLLCTTAYANLSPRFAMKIAKCATLEEIANGTWSAFAADVGLGAPFIRRRVRALADSAQSSVFRVADQLAEAGLDRDAMTKYASLVASRATHLAKRA